MTLPTPLLAEEAGSNGIRFGRARIHPFFDFFSYYQTNPGRMTSNAVSDVSLTIRPGFNLDYPGRSYEFYSNGNVEYRHFMGLNFTEGLESSNTANLSTVMGGLSLDGKLLKNSSFPLTLKAEFNRTDKPANQTQNRTLGRNSGTAEIGSDWTPGGGALKVGLSYKSSVSLYDGDNDSLETLNQKLTFASQWRFLPKTATFVEAIYANYGYLNPTAGVSGATEAGTDGVIGTDDDIVPVGYNVAIPVSSAYWGLSGQITPRISTIMKFGYGQTMEEGTSQASGFLTQFDVKYKASESIKYSAGFARTISGAVIFQHMMTNKVYLKGQTTLSRRYALGASLEYDMVDYGNPVLTSATEGTRSDSIIRAELVASAKITNWFVASLVNKYENLSTDYIFITGTDAPNYSYNDTFLRLSVRY
jgi:hypothetical protein